MIQCNMYIIMAQSSSYQYTWNRSTASSALQPLQPPLRPQLFLKHRHEDGGDNVSLVRLIRATAAKNDQMRRVLRHSRPLRTVTMQRRLWECVLMLVDAEAARGRVE